AGPAAAAATRGGARLLRHRGGIAGTCEQVLRRRPSDARAKACMARVTTLRRAGIQAREHDARRRALRRGGVVVLAVAVVAAAVVALLLDSRRRETEAA